MNPYANLSAEEIDIEINKTLEALNRDGFGEAAIDSLILQQRRKLDPYAPQTRAEFEREWARKEDLEWYERIGNGLAQTPEMFKYVYGTVAGALVDQAKMATDPIRGLKSIVEAGARGSADVWQIFKGMGGEIADWAYTRDEHIGREYERYLEDLEYQRAREAGLLFDKNEIFEDYAELGSLVLDPTNLIPFTAPGKIAAKAMRKGVQLSAKGGAKLAGGVRRIGEVVQDKASIPRRKFADFLNDVARMHPASAEGTAIAGTLAAAVTGVPVISPVGKALAGAEGLGMAAKIGGELGEGVLNALASDNIAKRFLTRVAESPDVPMLARRMANFARKNGGEWAMDKAFNAILGGMEIGAINGALQWAATGDPEGFGAGVAQGIAMSPIVGLAMPKGSGLTAQDRVNFAAQNFIETNGRHIDSLDGAFNRQILEDFSKTEDGKRTLEVLGALDGLAPELGLARKVHFLTDEHYKEIADDPTTDGQYNPANREIYIRAKKGSTANAVASTGLHEVGHYILDNMLESNKTAKDFLINEVTQGDTIRRTEDDAVPTTGVYLPSRANDPWTLRELKPEAAEFKKRYEYRVDEDGNILTDDAGKQIRRGPNIADIDTLILEMGAETIGELLYGTSPKGLLGLNNHAVRGAALGAVANLLSRFMPWLDTAGTAPDGAFKRLDPTFKGLPILKDLFDNYSEVRSKHLDWRTKLEEMDGVIKPKNGKTPRELVVDIAPDSQLFDTNDLEALDQNHGKKLRQNHKDEPPTANEATVGPRVKGDRSSGIGERLGDSTLKHFREILSKKGMSLLEELQNAIGKRRVIGGWYSRRSDKRGNNPLTYREMVPYGIGLTNQGNIILYGWNRNKLQDAIILAEEMGLVEGRTLDDGTKISAGDVLRQRITDASARQARGERINDELVAAMFGARYGKDTRILDARHIEFARELNRRRAHPSQTLRVDTMQGFRLLDKDGFMFNWQDVAANNRPNRPEGRAQGRTAFRRLLDSAERDDMVTVYRGGQTRDRKFTYTTPSKALAKEYAEGKSGAANIEELEVSKSKIASEDIVRNALVDLGYENAAGDGMLHEYLDPAFKDGFEGYYLGDGVHDQLAAKLTDMGYDAYEAIGNQLFSNKPTKEIVIFKQSSAERDYMQAVNDGDMETAQRLVDEAAKSAGYTVGPVYHGSDASFDVFDGSRYGESTGVGDLGEAHYFAASPEFASEFGSLVRPYYLKANFAGNDVLVKPEIQNAIDDDMGFTSVGEELAKMGYDGLRYDRGDGRVEFAVFNNKQIKSAEPVTQDNNGNVIPLSERFDADQSDIRFSAERDPDSKGFDKKLNELLNRTDEYIDQYAPDQRARAEAAAEEVQGDLPARTATRSAQRWATSRRVSQQDQRLILEVVASDRLLNKQEITGQIDRKSLLEKVNENYPIWNLKRRLATLLDVEKPQQATTYKVIDQTTDGGRYQFVGGGSESLVFYDNVTDRILKMGRVSERHTFRGRGDTNHSPFKLQTVGLRDVRQTFDGAKDFTALQALEDFNRAFDGGIEFHGFTDDMEFMVYSQDAYEPMMRRGEKVDATMGEIDEFMRDRGWQQVLHQGFDFWYHDKMRMVAADTHMGNILKTEDGLVPIDILTRQLSEAENREVTNRFGLNDSLASPSRIDEDFIKKIEGDKNQVAANLKMSDYPENPHSGSVALPARLGLVSQSAPGMPRTYKGVLELVERMVNRILHVKETDPEFAKRSASFYYDMADSALQLARATSVSGRNDFDLADLQLRFLALGSPRTGVSANAAKSARSSMSPHGIIPGHKLGFSSQQKGANFALESWDRGDFYDSMAEASGANDKVRNFYLNGLAELIDIAKSQNDLASADMLRNRAAKTLQLIKPDEMLDAKSGKALDSFLDGLATVDMWDMASKGQAHPAYIPRGLRAKDSKDVAFAWSVPANRVKSKISSSKFASALKDIQTDKRKVQSIEDLKWQEARALQIEGRDWNEQTWSERLTDGNFSENTEWSFYKKADEGGLSPGGGGRLYDAQQTIDGLIADRLNELGLASFYGKDQLKARNAQEILWAIEKLANPLPANQELVLFGDRFSEFSRMMAELRERDFYKADKKSPGRNILEAINDTYNKTHSQSLPFEVTTFGTTKQARAVQRAEAAAGVQNMTEQFAYGLAEDLQKISDENNMGLMFEEARVDQGGYTLDDGTYSVSPNIVLVMRGDPKRVRTILNGLNFGLDQEAGNVFRLPTVEELNSKSTKYNNAIIFDTLKMTPEQQKAFAEDLGTVLDADGNPFMDGFTNTADGMTIADQYYGENFLSEVKKNRGKIEDIAAKHGVEGIDIKQLMIDVVKRSPAPGRRLIEQDITTRRPVDFDPVERQVENLMQARVRSIKEPQGAFIKQPPQRERRIEMATQPMGAIRTESGQTFATSNARSGSAIDAKSQVDLLRMEGIVKDDEVAGLKADVDRAMAEMPLDETPANRRKKLKGIIKRTSKSNTARFLALRVLANMTGMSRDAVVKEMKKIVPYRKRPVQRDYKDNSSWKKAVKLWEKNRTEYNESGPSQGRSVVFGELSAAQQEKLSAIMTQRIIDE